MARLILDTGVVVAAVRGDLDLAVIGEQDDVALPAVAVAEYLTGVELDDDPARRAGQAAFRSRLRRPARRRPPPGDPLTPSVTDRNTGGPRSQRRHGPRTGQLVHHRG